MAATPAYSGYAKEPPGRCADGIRRRSRSGALVLGLVAVLAVSALCGCQTSDPFFSLDDSGQVKTDAAVRDGRPPLADKSSVKDTYNRRDYLPGCNPQNFTLKQAPPAEVYLVLDRSGSMLETGSTTGTTKWQELYDAVDFVLKTFDSTIAFGLLMYPSDSQCLTPPPQCPVAILNRASVVHYLSKAKPAGGTPTAAALRNAAKSLGDVGTTGAKKYIILATDGGPNCNYLLTYSPACTCTYATANYCCTNYPLSCYGGHTCLDDTSSLAVIKDLHDNKGITTFVVGLEGTAEYVKLLDAMAKAGGAPQTGSTTSYYKASSKTEIQTALKTIATSVISCEIDLASAPKYPDKVLIYLDGKSIARDKQKQNGWDYADSTMKKIKLYGSACKLLQDGQKHTLTATFACEVF